MDDITRLNEQLRRTKAKGLRYVIRQEERTHEGSPGDCPHTAPVPTIIRRTNGGTGYLNYCPACDTVLPPWLNKRQAEAAAMDALPVIIYRPDPELEGEVCHWVNCDRTDTMEHHVFPKHIFGDQMAEQGGTIWLCGEHHSEYHKGLKRWGQGGQGP